MMTCRNNEKELGIGVSIASMKRYIIMGFKTKKRRASYMQLTIAVDKIVPLCVRLNLKLVGVLIQSRQGNESL